MQNEEKLETVSLRLYEYLCEEIVGSKNIVNYRRLYYKLHDDISNETQYELISSGSKAEGLDLPGSDFDLMILWNSWEVYEDKPKDKEDILLLDTENALPGFALLKKADSSSFPLSPTLTDYGHLIFNSDFFMLTVSEIALIDHTYKTHGPCISSSFLVDLDVLNCLKCHSWPTVAKSWLLRFRPSGWPSQDIISKIVSQGCLLVPVGSKSSCSEGNPFEWRFSFSISEKLLIHSFNHTQLLCYVLLKIWVKEIVNSDNKLNNKLCSYFMKTVLFWILEEDENLNWIPQNLMHCFLLCIRRLHYWIVCGYFPNYFIPDHNMIDGKLSHDDLADLSLFFEKMNIHEIWKNMFSAPSLRNFCNLPIIIRRKPHHRLSEFDGVMLSLKTFGSFMISLLDGCRDSLSACIIYRMVNKHLPNSARKILILMFLKENKNIIAFLDIANRKNMQSYVDNKECLSRILLNTVFETESGWLILAAFFYSTKRYHEMSCILQLSSNYLSLKNHFVKNDVNMQSFREISKFKRMVYSGSFIKRMRYESSRVFDLDYKSFMNESYPFLSADIPNAGIVGGIQSCTFFFFLKFLNGRKHGNSLETQSALQMLKKILEKECDKSTNIISSFTSNVLLMKAFELMDDAIGYINCSLRFLKAFKRYVFKSDVFKAIMQAIQGNEDLKMILDNV